MRLLSIFLLIFVFTFAGCRPKISKDPSALEASEGGNPNLTPFILQLLSEVNDGTNLQIQGSFIPKTRWRSSDVIVRLVALDQNGEQRQAYFAVGEEDSYVELVSGVPTAFTLSIPSAGISNYQIELLWGSDAAPFQKTARMKTGGDSQFLALRNLQVHRIPSDDCSTPSECVVRFNLSGEFFNSGSRTVEKVVIVAGFARSEELDLQNQILENERRIEIRNMTLVSGAAKPFRLSLEKAVPLSDEMAPRPVVKIVSFESQP